MGKRILGILLDLVFLLVLVFFLSACSPGAMSEEKILEEAIRKNEEIKNYYGEYNVETHRDGKFIDRSLTREWKKEIDGEVNRKTEIDAENAGKTVTFLKDENIKIYNEKENKLYDFGDRLGKNPDLDKSMQDRNIEGLENIKEKPIIKQLGPDELDNREIYTIKGSYEEGSDETYSLVEINKESFLVERLIIKRKINKIEINTKKIDIEGEIDPSVFKIELPEDAREIEIKD